MQNCTQCKLAYTDPDDPYDVLPPYEDEEDGVWGYRCVKNASSLVNS